jgi:hypothetical protein
MNAGERDLRVRELRAQGHSQNTIARRLGISRRTVQRIFQRLDQRSPPAPRRLRKTFESLILMPMGERTTLTPQTQPRPSHEVGGEQSGTPTAPPGGSPQESGPPPIGEGRQGGAAEVAAEPTPMPPRGEALAPIARQLQEVAMRISRVEAQQPHQAQARTRQAEEALDSALREAQEVRAEQWKMMRDVIHSVGTLLQATEQLLQLLPGEGPEDT